MTTSKRRDFAFPPVAGTYDGIDLAMLDPSNEDDRRILIEAEHPELHDALLNDIDEVDLGGTMINPRLHIAMHEAVANQLMDDNPAEAWTTAQRLTETGYDRHEVLHMLASVVSGEIFRALRDHTPSDPARFREALDGLPASWEAQRTDIAHEHRANRAARRATRNRRR